MFGELKIKHIIKYFTRPDTFVSLLPWLNCESHEDYNGNDLMIFYLNDGSMGVGWKVNPAAAESFSDDELDDIYNLLEDALLELPLDGTISGQYIVTVGPSQPDDKIYQDYLNCSSINDTKDDSFKVPPLSLELAKSRAKYLASGAHGFWRDSGYRTRRIQYFLFIKFTPRKEITRWYQKIFYKLGIYLKILLGKDIDEELKSQLVKDQNALIGICSKFESSINAESDANYSGGRPSLSRLSRDEFCKLVWRHLNPGRSAKGDPYPDIADKPEGPQLREILAATEFETNKNGILFQDGWQTSAISFYQLPERSSANMFSHLLNSGEDFTLMTGFHFKAKSSEKASMSFSREMTHRQRFTFSSNVNIGSSVKGRDFDEALETLESTKTSIARISTLLVLARKNKEDSEIATNKLASLMSQVHGAKSWVEGFLSAQSYITVLPFFYSPEVEDYMRRDFKILTHNLVHFLPATGRWRGTPSAGSLLQNSGGDPILFNFFDNDAPHFMVAATTRAGKSFMINMLANDMVRAGGIVWVIDVYKSYEKLCEMLGGKYINMNLAKTPSINPLDVDSIDENRRAMITELLLAMIQVANKGKETGIITPGVHLDKAVQMAFEAKGWDYANSSKKGEEVFISEVAANLSKLGTDAKRLGDALHPYYGQGKYAKIFDKPNELDLSRNQFTVFDIAGLGDSKDLRSVVLLSVMFRVNEAMHNPTLHDRKKILMIDECWFLMEDANCGTILQTFSRAAGKVNGALGVISQSMRDFDSDAGKVIKQNSHTMIFLRQSKADLREFAETLDLTEEDARIISNLKMQVGRYSQAYVMTAKYGNGVVVYAPDKDEYWTYTARADDRKPFSDVLIEVKANRPFFAAKFPDGSDADIVLAVKECASRWPYGYKPSEGEEQSEAA
jgi:conjugal transfer ATP-binding protein TraC